MSPKKRNKFAEDIKAKERKIERLKFIEYMKLKKTKNESNKKLGKIAHA